MVQLLASLLLRVALLPLFEISSTSQKQFFFFLKSSFFQTIEWPGGLGQTNNNLGQNKMEQYTPSPRPPPPKSRMKPDEGQNTPFAHHWFSGGEGGGPKFSVYFVQDVGQTRQTNASFCYQGQMLSASVSKLKQKSLKRTYVVFKFNKQILRRALARPW